MSDNPIKFTAGLTTAVLLIAEIENVEDTDNLRIQVCNSEKQLNLLTLCILMDSSFWFDTVNLG